MRISANGDDEVIELLRAHVPELASGDIEIKAAAREPGNRTLLVIHASDQQIDPVSCCVGVRGERIKTIVQALRGEKIDVIPWTGSPRELIANSLLPMVARSVVIDDLKRRASVTVDAHDAVSMDKVRLRLVSEVTGYTVSVVET